MDEKKEKQNLSLLVVVVIMGMIIACAILYVKNPTPAPNSNVDTNIATSTNKTDSNTVQPNLGMHLKGDIDAEILVTEYSDIECPFCARFNEVMSQIMTDYGSSGKVAWQYKHFPLEQIHPTARSKAEATECAAELGGNDIFWKYLDVLIKTQDIVGSAKFVDLDLELFQTCIQNNVFAPIIEEHIKEGTSFNIEGAPYSVVTIKNGSTFIIPGAYPYGVVKLAIDMTLAGKNEKIIQELIDMIGRGEEQEKIEEFLTENYPEALSETEQPSE